MNEQLLRDRRVAPSILASDFARLGEQVAEVMDAGARVIHVDVMDGHFVPPISIGPLIVDAARATGPRRGRDARRPPDGRAAGAPRRWTSPARAPTRSRPTSRRRRTSTTRSHAIREAGCSAGLALNPGTPAAAVDALAGAYDLLLCMTVNPGWGGQPYIAASRREDRRAARANPRRHADRGRRRHRHRHRRAGRGGRRHAVRRRLLGLRRGRPRRGLSRGGRGRRRGLIPSLVELATV